VIERNKTIGSKVPGHFRRADALLPPEVPQHGDGVCRLGTERRILQTALQPRFRVICSMVRGRGATHESGRWG
jgi:hypothetical protein